MKKQIYALLPFLPKVNLWLGVKIYAFKTNLNANNVKRSVSGLTNVYTNVGSGEKGQEGWINLDWSSYPTVSYAYDCRSSLPFADATVKGIFTEHFFEHIDYHTEVPDFLSNCYRCLQPGGTVRIIVPDAEKYLQGYVTNGWNMLKQTRPLDDNLNDLLMGIRYETKMQLINEVFRQGGEHKYAWDFETLALCLSKAGFTKIYKMAYQNSNDPKLAIDQEIRRYESLYVEAIK